MNASLLMALGAFFGALLFALIITAWRQRVAAAFAASAPPDADMPPMISLIVPVRNGAEHLPLLLQDLHAQRYPKERQEVIVVDDHSTDRTRVVAEGMMRTWPQLQVVANEGEGKKAAIMRGARVAQGALVVLTDADARCGPDRVTALAAHWTRTRADLLLAPVRTDGRGGLVGRVQENEQAALMMVTAAMALDGHAVLANGANMAVAREAFHAVGGYHGDREASGDDVFLVQRMQRANRSVRYVADERAFVRVEAEPTWRAFWQQRLRWAGKMKSVRGAMKWWGALALLLPFVLMYVTCAVEWSVGQGLLRNALLIGAAWLLWLVPVLGLVGDGQRSLGQQRSAALALISLLLFCFYAPAIAVTSLFVRPMWKGRRL